MKRLLCPMRKKTAALLEKYATHFVFGLGCEIRMLNVFWVLFDIFDPGIWIFYVQISRLLGIGVMADSMRGVLGKWLDEEFRVFTLNSELWTFTRGFLGKVRTVSFSVWMNASEIYAPIESGIPVGGIRDLVLAVWLISSTCSVFYGGMIHVRVLR